MARTKQTARKSTGGKARRKQTATKRTRVAPQKRPSTSSPLERARARKRVAKEIGEANNSVESDVGEDECGKLRCEVRALEGKNVELSEKQRQLEDQKRKLEDQKRKLEEQLNEQLRPLEEQLRPLRRELKEVQWHLLTKRKRIEEVENSEHLFFKLPQEVWKKILENLDANDLFPLALSCRYFRQRQKELVARKKELKMVTNLGQKLREGQPASVEYIQFCKKKVVTGKTNEKAKYLSCLAGFHGHLPLLQELLKSSTKLVPYVAVDAVRGGQLETLQWLTTRRGSKWRWTGDSYASLIKTACEYGHFEILEWLRSEGCPWNAGACAGAAEGGHFEILKWLRSEGCPWSEEACAGAAEGGHLEVLKWLRSKGCPWDEEACTCAAREGHLEVLKWLRSEGCPWDARACVGAARNGHLEILKWLRSEDCPWNVYACAVAARDNRHPEIREWMRSEGYYH